MNGVLYAAVTMYIDIFTFLKQSFNESLDFGNRS